MHYIYIYIYMCVCMYMCMCIYIYIYIYGGPGSSVGIATDYRAGRSMDQIPVEVRFTAPVQTGPGAQPASFTMGTRSFPGVKSGRGVTLTPHPLLVPWSWKCRAIPLLPLWAARPVQSLSACTRVTFTFTLHIYIYIYIYIYINKISYKHCYVFQCICINCREYYPWNAEVTNPLQCFQS
jgi:hypothetical protein